MSVRVSRGGRTWPKLFQSRKLSAVRFIVLLGVSKRGCRTTVLVARTLSDVCKFLRDEKNTTDLVISCDRESSLETHCNCSLKIALAKEHFAFRQYADLSRGFEHRSQRDAAEKRRRNMFGYKQQIVSLLLLQSFTRCFPTYGANNNATFLSGGRFTRAHQPFSCRRNRKIFRDDNLSTLWKPARDCRAYRNG